MIIISSILNTAEALNDVPTNTIVKLAGPEGKILSAVMDNGIRITKGDDASVGASVRTRLWSLSGRDEKLTSDELLAIGYPTVVWIPERN